MSVDPQQPDRYADEDLSRRIQETVDALGESSSPLARPSTETVPGQPACPPEKIGQFHIKSVIASGGMGTVYEAFQEHPRRPVAVKVLKRGIASRSAMRRFEYESQTLARLRHPGIAQVYEAGTYDDGAGPVPYFAMEYIPHALPITAYAKEKGLTLRQRLELFADVCDAVHHGHQKGIIHRDLKPGNILVDSHGEVKVIDFGVARGTDSDMAVTTLQTDIGQLIGTLQYMSPEQCVADPHDIDTRSDVYALGVVFYELLSGKMPYDVTNRPVLESTRMIREEHPTRLSRVDAALRGDTETIVFKALEKDRERRYQSAVELAQDIRRYLSGEAIIARPPSIVYQLRVFARRNKAFFSAVAAAFVVLVGGVIVSTSLYVQAERQRQRAVVAEQEQSRERQRAELAERDQTRERERAELSATQAEAERDRAIEAEQTARKAEHEARRLAYSANIAAAAAAFSANEIAAVRRCLQAAPEEFRNWEWNYMHAQSDNSLKVLRGHEDAVLSVVFAPDGTRLASASLDKTVRVWHISMGAELAVLRGHEKAVYPVTFSTDGTRLASGSWDNTVRLWGATGGKELSVLRGHEGPVRRTSFSPDGTRLATVAAGDRVIRLWDSSNGVELAVLRGHDAGVNTFAFSPDGRHLASASDDKTVRIWDAFTAIELAVVRGHEGHVNDVRFGPDGTRVASGSGDRTVRIWDAFTGGQLAVLNGHNATVFGVRFSPDGTRLASISRDKTVRLWNASTGEQLRELKAHDTSLWDLTFSPDGTQLASLSDDRTIRIWDTDSGEEIVILRGHERPGTSVVFNPDGTRLASASMDKTVRLWDPGNYRRLTILRGHGDFVNAVAFSRDGTRVASGSGQWGTPLEMTVRLWDPATGEELAVLRGHENAVWSVAFSPDGTFLASASEDRTARLWDAGTGEELVVLRGHEAAVTSAAFSPDGSRIASGSMDKTMRLWEVATGTELRVVRSHEESVRFVAFSAQGSSLASGSDDKTIRLWDASSAEQRAVLRGHEAVVWYMVFSPDGKRLASASDDRTVRLWDASNGVQLAVLHGHEDSVNGLAFNRDGTRLASGSYDGTVRLWDAFTGEELIALRGHRAEVEHVAFSPDGTRLASGSHDRTVRIWDGMPFAVRDQERQMILAARPEAERVVDELWQQPFDAKSILERLRADASLTEPQRRAALNLLLSKSVQLQDQVNDLYARLVFTDDVVSALEADDSLSPGVRSRAVGIARRKGDRPLRLNHDSWNLVRSPGGDTEAHRVGLRGAEAAVAIEPDNVDFLDTLGMAQYRNDRYGDAHATLTRSDELRQQKGSKSVPRDLAVLSMAVFKLGRMEEARAAFQRLENVMSDTEEEWTDDKAASALFDECKQLLEGSQASPAPPVNARGDE
ncbi:MAG: protein kinase [Planctomycetota bacterium]